MGKLEGARVPWVRVIVVNYNGGGFLQSCVDALARQTLEDFEAVIVDNASSDGSPNSLVLPDERFQLVRSGANLGFAAGNNLGARACEAPWIATLNPDTVAEPSWLDEMRRGVERHPGARMFGATLVSAKDPTLVDGFGDVLSIAGIPWRGGHGRPVASLPDGDLEVFSPCAAAALYDRRSFERAGGFDETFFCYVEDVDLGLRLRLAGERCIQLRRAIVRHHGSAIAGEMSDFVLYHSYRNRLWLLLKNLPLPLLAVAVPLNILCSAIIIWRFASKGLPVRAAIRGLIAGMMPATVCAARREVQRSRTISLGRVARLLVWRLGELRRRPVVGMR